MSTIGWAIFMAVVEADSLISKIYEWPRTDGEKAFNGLLAIFGLFMMITSTIAGR